MTSIFIILNLFIGVFTIYWEIKNKERNDKIFYTFYMVWLWIIITPFIWALNNLIINIAFTIIYGILLYGIYSDFEFLTIIKEFMLTIKEVNKEEINKLDYEFIKIVKKALKELNYLLSLKVYKVHEIILDEILISIGIIIIWIFIILMIYK